jgi:hypothetical protein
VTSLYRYSSIASSDASSSSVGSMRSSIIS